MGPKGKKGKRGNDSSDDEAAVNMLSTLKIEEPSQERIGIDFLGDSNSQYTSDEDMSEGKQISEDGDKSADDDWQAEYIETISGEEEEKGVGIDFLGKEQNYKKQLDNSKNTNKLIVDFNDSGDEHYDEEWGVSQALFL